MFKLPGKDKNHIGHIEGMVDKSTYRIPLIYAFIGLIGILIVFFIEYLGFLKGIDNYAYDISFRLRGQRGHSEDIIIAAIDEKTLNKLGRWPIKRSYYALLLERLSEAKLVVFDIVMVEPTDDDVIIDNAFAKHGRVVLPLFIEGSSHNIVASRFSYAAGMGHVHLEEDIDGVVRMVFHTISAGEINIPSITSVAYEMITRKTYPRTPGITSSPGKIVQSDPMKINYYGRPGTFQHIPLIDILEDRDDPEAFKNAVVIVGATAAGISPRLLTPFSGSRDRMAGVEVHANILNNIINNEPIKDVSQWLELLFCIIISGLSFALFLRLSEGRSLLFWIAQILFVFIAIYSIFILFNLWYNPATLIFSLSFIFIISYLCRLHGAASRLDTGYTSIQSIPGLNKKEIQDATQKSGLFSLFSAGGINAKAKVISELIEKLKLAYVQISDDLKAAVEVQEGLLPTSGIDIDGVYFEWIFYPCRFVGGDMFNYFQIDKNHIGFYIADVTGHGVPAAMLSVTISKILSPEFCIQKNPDYPENIHLSSAAIVKELNHFFASSSKTVLYFSIIFGITNTETYKTTICQAGHPPPILIRKNGEMKTVGKGGLLVGAFDDIEFEEEIIQLDAGDRLCLYSDGVIECFNKEMKQFSTERLQKLLLETRLKQLKESLGIVKNELFAWSSDKELDDDLTMLAFEIVKPAKHDA